MLVRAGLAGLLCGCALAGSALAAPPLADYGKLPTVEQLRLSPDGEKIAYMVAKDDTRRIVVRKYGGGDLFAVNVGTLKPRSVKWLDDGHLLVEASEVFTSKQDIEIPSWGNFEAFQSTIIDANTGKATIVFGDNHLIFHATFGHYGVSQEGGHFGYFGGLTLTGSGSAALDLSDSKTSATHGYTDLYKVNLDTGQAQKISGGSMLHDISWVVGPKGEIVAHTEYDEKTSDWRLYADPNDTVQIAGEYNPIDNIDVVGMGRTADSVLVRRPSGSAGNFTLLEYPTRTGAAGVDLFGGKGIRSLLLDGHQLLIGGVTNEDDPQTILFDSARQAKFDMVKRVFKGESVFLISATPSLDRMIVETAGAGDSGTYFIVDLPTKKVEAIGWEYPTILQGDVAETKSVTYKAGDGLEIEGVLTLPPGRPAKNLPLVVLPHGGPEARDYAWFNWWAQAFASRGYAVLQPNFRGSDGFGKAFRDAGFGQWGRKMQTDISDGVADLARQGIIDPKRACIVGASYGGYAALAGVTVQQGLYRCAVSVGGISDLNDLLNWIYKREGERSASMRYDREFLGVKGNSDSSLNAYSPRHLVARADAPILLIYGKDDTVVSIDQSRYMAADLRGAGKPVEVLQLPDEDHWMSKAATRTAMLEASVAFVEKNNPPDTAAGVTK